MKDSKRVERIFEGHLCVHIDRVKAIVGRQQPRLNLAGQEVARDIAKRAELFTAMKECGAALLVGVAAAKCVMKT